MERPPEYSNNIDSSFLPENPLIQKAFQIAKDAHTGQFRKSGEPYIEHCLAVTKIILDEWQQKDPKLIAASLCHDTTEDTDLNFEQIVEQLGLEVATIVEGVSEFKSEKDYGGKKPTKAEKDHHDRLTLRKVISKSYLDLRVAILKLGDRTHNMRTQKEMPVDKQEAKAIETAKVHTKLAEALGMWKVKTELEDLSFFYKDRTLYSKIKEEIDGDERISDRFIDFIKTSLQSVLLENELKAEISIRKGGIYELARKRARLALEGESDPDNFKTIDDVISFRVVVASEKERSLFFEKLLSNYGKLIDYDKIDFYIGENRRDNGYEAMHVVVNSPYGPYEIAIVTEKEEEFNNEGVLCLLRKNASEEELESYKLKLVFTPEREIVFLNKKATGIDFAYALNPQLGAQAEYLLIDGVKHSLTSVVPNASVVEIVLSNNPRRAPILDLRNYCLPSTLKIIESQIRLQKRDELVSNGKLIMEEYLKPFGLIDLKDLGVESTKLICDFGCQTLDDIYFKTANVKGYSNRIIEWLNFNNLTKQKLGLTTIKLTGINQPGILSSLSSIIKEHGGDIATIETPTPAVGNSDFILKFVIKGLFNENQNNEEIVKQILENDKRFRTVLLV